MGNHVPFCCHPEKYWPHPLCVKLSPQCCNFCVRNKNILISLVCASLGQFLNFKDQNQSGSTAVELPLVFHNWFIWIYWFKLPVFVSLFQAQLLKHKRNFGFLWQFCSDFFFFPQFWCLGLVLASVIPSGQNCEFWIQGMLMCLGAPGQLQMLEMQELSQPPSLFSLPKQIIRGKNPPLVF